MLTSLYVEIIFISMKLLFGTPSIFIRITGMINYCKGRRRDLVNILEKIPQKRYICHIK